LAEIASVDLQLKLRRLKIRSGPSGRETGYLSAPIVAMAAGFSKA